MENGLFSSHPAIADSRYNGRQNNFPESVRHNELTVDFSKWSRIFFPSFWLVHKSRGSFSVSRLELSSITDIID